MTRKDPMKLASIMLGAAVVAGAGVGGARLAAAQEPGSSEVADIEVPTLVLEEGAATGGGDDFDIDLANVVQSAARGVTTVQEAPAIVTVITEEEIRDRHAHTLTDLIDAAVPGYLRAGLIHNQFPLVTARGQVQASQYLHDSISLFDPYVNVATVTPVQPMEIIKRIEVITGPGGVLWGSNSLLGIINVITKDAEDVDGVEVGVTGGHGNGNREYLHGYVMTGQTGLLGGDTKVFAHASFKSYLGPGYEMPNQLFSAPLPQPNSPVLYGPLTQAQPPRSMAFTTFLKITKGNTQLRVWAPFYERHLPVGFPGIVVREHLPEDDLEVCQQNPELPGIPGDGCVDKGRTTRNNQANFFDRYAVLEYRNRMAGGKAGISAKAYLMQFVRDFPHLQILAGIDGLLEGGLAFQFEATSYRPGAAIDGDVELNKKTRLLYGVEAFHEFAPNNVTRARQGEGIEANFLSPVDLERLPLACPREPNPDMPGTARIMPGCPLTFAFPSSRTVLGAYLAPQWRPVKKLILDVGGRVQAAPEELGKNGYDPTLTFAASAVYNFLPAWHLKVNFAQGFRPPVFNNLNSNGEAVQIDGRPDLAVETTDAFQTEVNARLFKGDRRIRELNFRVDYSYTRIQNLIQVTRGRYENTADRGLNSVEFLGKLYIQGGHRIELGYTWLTVDTADKGRVKAMPEHWFNLAGFFNVIDEKLSATTALRVVGAHEDANRIVEHRILRYCQPGEMSCTPGQVINSVDPTSVYVRTFPYELVMDRIPAAAELMLGMRLQATPNLILNLEAFNALNGRYYNPDLFYDYEPRLEFLPNPLEDLRVFLGATYTH